MTEAQETIDEKMEEVLADRVNSNIEDYNRENCFSISETKLLDIETK